MHIFTLEEEGALSFRASTARGDALARLRELALRQGNGIVGAAAEGMQPVLVNDVRQDPRYIGDDWHTLAELAVPLRFGDRTIGVLDVQSAEANRFSESDLFVMRTLADQIAVAIESARAFTAQREEAWTLNSLLQVAENIARASSLDDLLPGIVRLPPLLLGCDRCYVLVWGRERGTFTPLAAYGLTPEQRAAFIGKPFDEAKAPLLAEARRTMTPIAVGEAQSRQYMCPPILEPFGGSALLALPLTARGSALGMLVADYDPPQLRIHLEARLSSRREGTPPHRHNVRSRNTRRRGCCALRPTCCRRQASPCSRSASLKRLRGSRRCRVRATPTRVRTTRSSCRCRAECFPGCRAARSASGARCRPVPGSRAGLRHAGSARRSRSGDPAGSAALPARW